jgi:hypothetical protein
MQSTKTTTPTELADELEQDPKAVRAWLRANGIRSDVERWQRWVLSEQQADLVRAHFETVASVGVDPHSYFDPTSRTAGELLGAYTTILDELRVRGLVRTNNAPIGDLAEYACAIVYGGVLAPNSEKSYDLVAADGRRVQVKVRNMRADTRPSSAFSVIRSFTFDVCIFVLIDTESQRVRGAYEWTVEEVRENSVHREHTNGATIRVSQARRFGIDLTDRVDEAWQEMLALI